MKKFFPERFMTSILVRELIIEQCVMLGNFDASAINQMSCYLVFKIRHFGNYKVLYEFDK